MSEADASSFQDPELTAKALSMGALAATDNLPDGKERLVPLLLSVSKSTRALTAIKLAELDFHSGQDELLLELNEGMSVTVSKLADKLNVRPSTASKMLDRLMRKGLVERTSDRRDARRTVVRITPAGLIARSSLLKLRRELNADLMMSFPGNPDAIFTSLEAIDTIIKTRLSRLR